MTQKSHKRTMDIRRLLKRRLDPRPFGRASCHKCPAIYEVPAYYCTNMKDVPMVKSCPCGFDAINYRGCIWDIKPSDRTVKDKSGFRRKESAGEAGKRAAQEMLKRISDRYDRAEKRDAAKRCKRCGNLLIGGYCKDETCPFSDHLQRCPAGWESHPEHVDGRCTCGEVK